MGPYFYMPDTLLTLPEIFNLLIRSVDFAIIDQKNKGYEVQGLYFLMQVIQQYLYHRLSVNPGI